MQVLKIEQPGQPPERREDFGYYVGGYPIEVVLGAGTVGETAEIEPATDVEITEEFDQAV